MTITPISLEENQPFDFAKFGLVWGTMIKGNLITSNLKENIDGVVWLVCPKYIVIKKHSGIRTTVHMAHVISGEAVFKVVNGKREAV